MKMHHVPAEPALGYERQATIQQPGHKPWLVLARIGWLTVALLSIGLFVASIPSYYGQLLTHSASTLNDPAGVSGRLAQIGLSIAFYAAYSTVVVTVMATIFFLIAILIFLRKTNEPMPLGVSLVLVMFGAIFPNTMPALAAVHPVLTLLLVFLNYMGFFSFFLLFYLFPDGKFVPRWTRWLALLWLLLGLPNFFLPQSFLDTNTWPPLLAGPLYICLFGSLVVAQIYRYRRVSNHVQRQQTKWVIFGFLTSVTVFFVASSPNIFSPSLLRSGSLYDLVYIALLGLSFSSVPISIAFAIFKYHLYDIDVLINRTLVYSTLSALLALVYFGLIFSFQSLTHVLTGRAGDNPLVIVTSTLVIAALFQPLRHRIQAIIDRRFYRRKYDAVRTLETFSTALRNEVDLNQLSEQLMAVVQETMQPTYISLWLRSSEHMTKQQAASTSHFQEHEELGDYPYC